MFTALYCMFLSLINSWFPPFCVIITIGVQLYNFVLSEMYLHIQIGIDHEICTSVRNFVLHKDILITEAERGNFRNRNLWRQVH
jgi:hypothetical protein